MILTQIKRNFKDLEFWKVVNIALADRLDWMTFDDEWVDEVRRGLLAYKVFLWYPLYYLAYNQMTGNLVSHASTMTLGNILNDIIAKLNPILIISVMFSSMDFVLYPLIRKLWHQPHPYQGDVGFSMTFRMADRDEDRLNNLKQSRRREQVLEAIKSAAACFIENLDQA